MDVSIEAQRPSDKRISFDYLASRLRARLSLPTSPPSRPALVMLCGLPGVGKSHLARRLAERLPFVVVQSDWVRKTIYRQPTYSARESWVVHEVCHRLLASLLAEGYGVIFDATNLQERNRSIVYNIAEEAGATLVIVRVTAPLEVVWERMERRRQGEHSEDYSDADWDTYLRFAGQEEPIRRRHLVVDAGGPIEGAVEEIARLVNMR